MPAGAVRQRPTARHGLRGSSVVLRVLSVALPAALAGYALDDRGFAYLASVPGTPLFAGELILLLGGAYAALATGYLKVALRDSLPMLLLLVFVAWGLARTLPFISRYGLDAIRDASLWYYALMAVVVAMLVVASPDLPHRWARAYVPFVVVLLLWSPLGIALAGATSPTLPGGVPLFSHKLGNIAVTAATATAFLWLVPTHSLSKGVRAALTGLAVLTILAAGTQNRGGLVASGVALLLTGLLVGRRGWNMAAVMAGTVLVVFVLGWGTNVQIPGGQNRYFSVAQLLDNATSITQGQNSADLGATVAFRDQLWSGAIDLANSQGALVTGLGFGAEHRPGAGRRRRRREIHCEARTIRTSISWRAWGSSACCCGWVSGDPGTCSCFAACAIVGVAVGGGNWPAQGLHRRRHRHPRQRVLRPDAGEPPGGDVVVGPRRPGARHHRKGLCGDEDHGVLSPERPSADRTVDTPPATLTLRTTPRCRGAMLVQSQRRRGDRDTRQAGDRERSDVIRTNVN